MGTDNLNASVTIKKDGYTNVVTVKAVAVSAKPTLVQLTANDIKAKRVAAYKYLLP